MLLIRLLAINRLFSYQTLNINTHKTSIFSAAPNKTNPTYSFCFIVSFFLPLTFSQLNSEPFKMAYIQYINIFNKSNVIIQKNVHLTFNLIKTNPILLNKVSISTYVDKITWIIHFQLIHPQNFLKPPKLYMLTPKFVKLTFYCY